MYIYIYISPRRRRAPRASPGRPGPASSRPDVRKDLIRVIRYRVVAFTVFVYNAKHVIITVCFVIQLTID